MLNKKGVTCDLLPFYKNIHYVHCQYYKTCDLLPFYENIESIIQDICLDVLYVCDVILKINVRYVIINRFLRYIQ